MPNDNNLPNVRGTKTSGEPPLLLAISVWTAILDAVWSATGRTPDLEIPATQEQILRALYPDKFASWEKK
jgi:xanthine dehydrogenase large subunit